MSDTYLRDLDCTAIVKTISADVLSYQIIQFWI